MQEFFKYGWLFKEIWGRCTHIFFIFHLCIYLFTYIYTWWIEKRSENCSFGSSDRGSPQLITWCPPPSAKRPIWLSAGPMSVCVCACAISGERCSVSPIKAFQTTAPLVSRSGGAPCALRREDKDAIVQGDRSRAHLTAAPPIASPLRAAPQVSSVCPLGGRWGQRLGRQKAPVGRTDGKWAAVKGNTAKACDESYDFPKNYPHRKCILCADLQHLK